MPPLRRRMNPQRIPRRPALADRPGRGILPDVTAAIGGGTVPPDFGDPNQLLWTGDEDVLDLIKPGG